MLLLHVLLFHSILRGGPTPLRTTAVPPVHYQSKWWRKLSSIRCASVVPSHKNFRLLLSQCLSTINGHLEARRPAPPSTRPGIFFLARRLSLLREARRQSCNCLRSDAAPTSPNAPSGRSATAPVPMSSYVQLLQHRKL